MMFISVYNYSGLLESFILNSCVYSEIEIRS
jgi:hypothetical protein